MTSDPRLSIGANNPPEEEQIMIERLTADHSDALIMFETNINKAGEMPLEITDDATSGKVSDYLKKLKEIKRLLNSRRETEKAPHDRRAGVIQNFFKSKIETIDTIYKKIDEGQAKYLKEKEDRKRREAEEKAERDRLEAERKLKEAQEKERIANEERIAAEKESQRLREQAEKERKEREAEAEKVRKQAEAEAARKKKEAEEEQQRIRDEAARIQKEKDDKIAALEQEKKDIEAKREEDKKAAEKREREIEREKKRLEKEKEDADREAERDAERVRKDAEKEATEKLKEGNREARELEREGRQADRQADADIADLNKEVRDMQRDADHSLDTAIRADRVATRSEKATQEKGSVLSRTRGQTSLSSVTEKWVGSPESRDALLPSAHRIWNYIPFYALEQACQAAVNAGERDIPGVIITQEVKTVNR